MHHKFISILGFIALAGASPVPYSTEVNYGSFLTPAEEAVWSISKRDVNLASRSPRELSKLEKLRTKTLLNRLFDMWIGHPKNRADALDAVLDKVEDGAASQEVSKREMMDTQTPSPE